MAHLARRCKPKMLPMQKSHDGRMASGTIGRIWHFLALGMNGYGPQQSHKALGRHTSGGGGPPGTLFALQAMCQNNAKIMPMIPIASMVCHGTVLACAKPWHIWHIRHDAILARKLSWLRMAWHALCPLASGCFGMLIGQDAILARKLSWLRMALRPPASHVPIQAKIFFMVLASGCFGMALGHEAILAENGMARFMPSNGSVVWNGSKVGLLAWHALCPLALGWLGMAIRHEAILAENGYWLAWLGMAWHLHARGWKVALLAGQGHWAI